MKCSEADLVVRCQHAWERLTGTRPRTSATVLQHTAKSSVVRLVGAHLGADVIAKRKAIGRLQNEAVAYGQVLPQLGVCGLSYYGCVDQQEHRDSWLFVEDAGLPNYDVERNTHRVAAAHWLAAFQNGSPKLSDTLRSRLRDRSLARYLGHLTESERLIHQHSQPVTSGANGSQVLMTLLETLAMVREHWRVVQQVDALLPSGVVHGDLVPKNVRVTNGASLVVFDWGTFGWGTALVDLAQSPGQLRALAVSPDLDTFLAERVGSAAVGRDRAILGAAATMLRTLSAIEWSAWSLAYPDCDDTIGLLERYSKALARGLRQLTQ